MNLAQRQSGLTLYGAIFVMMTMLFLGRAAVIMGPIYLERMSIESIVNDVAEEARGDGLSRRMMQERLAKKIKISNIHSLNSKSIKIKDEDDFYEITARYEVREEFMFNIDIVMKFVIPTVKIIKT
ncbi:MAG: DUF4845 domain-containing protein [Pseudomonadales bacterium]